METKQISYDVCRLYLQDNRALLGPLYDIILGFLRNRDIEKLSSTSSLFAEHCNTAEMDKVLRQIEAFFKKNAAFVNDQLCRSAAMASFQKSELRCRITNRRLDHYFVHRDRLDPDMNKWLSRCESFIRRALGPFHKFMEEIPYLIRVTDGATSTRSRRQSLPYLKVSKKLMCSEGSKAYLQALSQYYGYGSLRLERCSLNRVETVPKNWKTHRTIACEPTGNMPLQLAFDSYAKRRLRRYGVDLKFQSRNQEMARLGSIDNSFCTIDLKNASDTVSFNTVAWLFPDPWFRYLNDVRSTHYKGAFGYGLYSKFSSMGNGSTFCIETLVFASACYAVGSKQFVVYGDDIVIEGELFEDLCRILRFLGFVINQDKSFSNGPFRESCGKHWWKGIDVTPFYLRWETGMKPEFCHVINGLVALNPFGALADFCFDLVSKLRLPLVPFNDQSTSGIFVDVRSAYALKILRRSSWVTKYRSYLPKMRKRYVGDSRTLFLWYLDSLRLKNRSLDSPLVRSWIPLTEHRYVRKWVCWRMPTGSTPDHLYWWSDRFTQSNS